MHKVIIADDHAIFRDGLRLLLSSQGYENIVQAECAEQLKVALEEHPDCNLVLCDCNMPGEGPLSILAHIQEHFPHVRVLFVTGMNSTLLFQQLLGAGAHGIAVKSGDIAELINAIEQVLAGTCYIPQDIKQKLADASELFTNKEFVVLELILIGLPNPQIAERLCNSESTINSHRVNIMRKSNCKNIVQLVHFARDNGLYFSDDMVS